MIEFVNAERGGLAEVYLAPGFVSGGLVDVTIRPKYGSEAALAMKPSECLEFAYALTLAAEEAEKA